MHATQVPLEPQRIDGQFEEFLEMNPSLSQIATVDKESLRKLCIKGKAMGNQASEARNKVATLKSQMDEMKTSDDADISDIQIEKIVEDIKRHKSIYVLSMNELKGVKSQIEQLQKCIEMRKSECNSNFEAWMSSKNAL